MHRDPRSAAVAHYRHHADADEAVFQRYVLKVTAALSETRASLLSASDGAADAQAGILEAADAVIEPVLAEMDAARASARLPSIRRARSRTRLRVRRRNLRNRRAKQY
jgi:hypothetical protein